MPFKLNQPKVYIHKVILEFISPQKVHTQLGLG